MSRYTQTTLPHTKTAAKRCLEHLISDVLHILEDRRGTERLS